MKTVLDLFCGAGGFSLGFKQAGFTITAGVDNWQPAVDTFNNAYGLSCEKADMLAFEHATDLADLPETTVIIGSPPCVNFSLSNHLKDEEEGMRMVHTFLRVVAIKKHQLASQLRAWAFEQVPRVCKYLRPSYTFKQLGLVAWAKKLGKDPLSIALQPRMAILNAADYGTPQHRRRLFAGEGWQLPKPTHQRDSQQLSLFPLPSWRTVGDVRALSSQPTVADQQGSHTIQLLSVADRQRSFKKKQGNSYMGAMQPVEPLNKPSRCVMARDRRGSRECLIWEDKGMWRMPTVRECACLMGYPLTFEFLGTSHSAKRILVGNSVCLPVSFAIAEQLKQRYND